MRFVEFGRFQTFNQGSDNSRTTYGLWFTGLAFTFSIWIVVWKFQTPWIRVFRILGFT